MTSDLLFVCASNVCRSPLMAHSFADALKRGSTPGYWVVMSRGVTAMGARPICELAASLIDGTTDGAKFAEMHSSTVVEAATLEMQDLIITATRDERARLARIVPALRARTFTLREAVALGAHVKPSTPCDGPLTLASYSALLNSRRGRVSIDRSRRNWNRWAAQIDPVDVPDVHADRPRRHMSTLRGLIITVNALHNQVTRYVSPSPSSHDDLVGI